MKPLFIKDEIYLKHNTGINHPEDIKHLIAIYDKVAHLKERLNILKPIKATKEQILTVHTQDMYKEVEYTSRLETNIDADTICSSDSFEVAHYAAGAGIKAIDEIKSYNAHLAFCAVRPPGHHATPSKSMGFCLFTI